LQPSAPLSIAVLRPALELLASKPSLSSVKLDLIPALCRHQLQRPSDAAAAHRNGAAEAPSAAGGAAAGVGVVGGGGLGLLRQGSAAAGGGEEEELLPGADYLRRFHAGAAAARGAGASGGSDATAGQVAVYMAPLGKFCGRVNTLQAYGDINREVRSAAAAPLPCSNPCACVPLLQLQAALNVIPHCICPLFWSAPHPAV
jgi:hypothetical protein